MRKMLPVLLGLMSTGAFAADGTFETRFINTKGETIGKVDLTQIEAGVLVSARASKLPPGDHGFHFHETGDCDAGTAFKSAGDHYAAGTHVHGLDVAGGPHAGDMPNQIVDEHGNLYVNVLNTRVSLTGSDAPLLDDDGSALIVHAGVDDYRSQPSGDAGDRIACAEVVRKH